MTLCWLLLININEFLKYLMFTYQNPDFFPLYLPFLRLRSFFFVLQHTTPDVTPFIYPQDFGFLFLLRDVIANLESQTLTRPSRRQDTASRSNDPH